MESQAFITSTKKTPTCDVLGPSGLVIDLFLLCQAGNLLKIRSTRLRSVFLQIYKLYPCIYYINNVSINQLWMIWPGKRAERRGVGEVLGLCLHWGSWGDPHFQKRHFQSTPSSVKIIEPSHHFSIYNPFQSIFLIISTTLSFLLPEVIFRWAAFTTFGAFWKCQGEYNNPSRKGNPSSMGPWPNSTSLNQLGFRWPSGGDQSGRINS